MKATIKQQILENLNTGNERIVNDTLYFGVGNQIYMYKDDAVSIGYEGKEMLNGLFVEVQRDDLDVVLEGLLKSDGYLGMI